MASTIINYFYQTIGIQFFSSYIVLNMLTRAIIVYFVGITIFRFNKTLFGIRTPFNTILFVMLGSIFAQSIIDEKIFIPVVFSVLFLILLNGVVNMLAYIFPLMELFVKGKHSILVKNGRIQWKEMQKNFVTKNELYNELQTQLHTKDLETVSEAFLASDGTINFIVYKNL